MLALSTAPAIMPPAFPVQAGPLTVERLTSGYEGEVLAFLATRPIHTVIMTGLIRDHGLVSQLNRGVFYACRNMMGRIEGVALIGHITMIETLNDSALQRFVELAQNHQRAHVIIGEVEKVERFWELYASSGQPMRLACRELLFEQRWPVQVHESLNLRQATLDDIEQIMPVHAQMAFEECGINPMEKDPVGFRERVAYRIEKGRVWTCTDQGLLICKADVVSDTPEQIYLEGVYVSPEHRGQGYGARFISQLARTLLAKTQSLSVLVNEQNRAAQLFYQKAGYKLRCFYDTIYLEQNEWPKDNGQVQ
ncbi:MAG: GNAT family N-acetyltransferase [Acidobacteriota bacterium]|nr:GNAT family N-acetyltransferase [Acidobacteriota bacterium]